MLRQYKSVPAVDRIDFAIDRAHVVDFLGTDGAGKPTTLNELIDRRVLLAAALNFARR